MKKIVRLSFAVCALLFSGLATAHEVPARIDRGNDTESFLACGWGNVSIFTYDPQVKTLEESWFWKPEDYSGIADLDRFFELFHHIDECKSVDGGDTILITASTDGVGLIDRKGKRFLQLGVSRNAHSADFLPGGRIAVANSHGGDTLQIFDGREMGKLLIEKPLSAGHGVHWDSKSKRLYALASEEIDIYELVNWDSESPDLNLVRRITLPEGEGHNLSQIPCSDQFHISTASQTWLFDESDESVVAHPQLSGQRQVKSVSTNRNSGAIVWLKADSGSWWSYNLRLIHDDVDMIFPVNKRYYKVRWIGGE
ncbi:hypothetical protein EB810_15170 [Altererythrobacter sp. FM1]|uniref:DUF6528 family protein n=1 Tax=Tsuneonella flava TaxID=2055955 RepID=UPI000C80FC08|nr:DUF6528 family protein [Tsuneonella flava]ROT93424.1 hypothetical protein EB810_15170 [Altererythrobacter sp. FM1]